MRSDIERLLSGTGSMLGALSGELAERPGRRACERLIGLVPRATRMYSSVGVAEADGTLYCGAAQAGLIRPGSVSVRGSDLARRRRPGERARSRRTSAGTRSRG